MLRWVSARRESLLLFLLFGYCFLCLRGQALNPEPEALTPETKALNPPLEPDEARARKPQPLQTSRYLPRNAASDLGTQPRATFDHGRP